MEFDDYEGLDDEKVLEAVAEGVIRDIIYCEITLEEAIEILED